MGANTKICQLFSSKQFAIAHTGFEFRRFFKIACMSVIAKNRKKFWLKPVEFYFISSLSNARLICSKPLDS
jgi:hypothetical protein